jgi:GDP-4-dehydro-6-deoxy-D-mannose reductase
MSKKILITGVNGFVGKHLVNELKRSGYHVLGVGREPEVHVAVNDLLDNYFIADLTLQEDVGKLPLEQIDSVVSLAGLAQVGSSFADPEKYKKVNTEVFSMLAEELLARSSKTRVVAVSTGAVYDSRQPMPLTENSRLISQGSPYALSKILMEKSVQEFRKRGLDCVIVRPFNHIGPGQEPGFLLPDLYKKIKEIEKTGGTLKVGNLETKRDYTDVRDVVRAYADLATAENLEHSLYNVCSGRSVAGKEILNLLLQKMDITGKIETTEDPDLIRPNDPKDIYGSFERLQKEVGWQPQIALDQTIKDFAA